MQDLHRPRRKADHGGTVLRVDADAAGDPPGCLFAYGRKSSSVDAPLRGRCCRRTAAGLSSGGVGGRVERVLERRRAHPNRHEVQLVAGGVTPEAGGAPYTVSGMCRGTSLEIGGDQARSVPTSKLRADGGAERGESGGEQTGAISRLPWSRVVGCMGLELTTHGLSPKPRSSCATPVMFVGFRVERVSCWVRLTLNLQCKGDFMMHENVSQPEKRD